MDLARGRPHFVLPNAIAVIECARPTKKRRAVNPAFLEGMVLLGT